MKKCFILLSLFIISCSSPNTGNIRDATILNWENDTVTTEQFIKDHKSCLGVNRPYYEPRSRISKLIAPNQSTQMPKWDGLWVTFQSNEYRDIGQRSLMSVPPSSSSRSISGYRRCMFKLGYLLRAG